MTRNSRKLQKTPKQQNNENQKSRPQRDKQSPLGISFVVPTEMVKLPTGGRYYPSSNPLRDVEQVEIRHMTAREEDLLSGLGADTQDNLYVKLIDQLLVEDKYSASDFCEEDKTALLLSARATGYGSEYIVNDICLSCGEFTNFVFDLKKTDIIEPEVQDIIYNQDMDEFTLKLPVSEFEITIKNFGEKDSEFLEKEKKQKEKYDIEYNYTTSYLNRIIISVEGHTDPEVINKLVNVMPAADAKLLNQVYNNCRPRLSTSQEVGCEKCGAKVRKEVPVSWAFFRINQ